jgi:iduronate 2-sulfatase
MMTTDCFHHQVLGLWNSTIVIFWGDHGWKLGHHGAWAKHTNFQEDTLAPVLLRIPGLTDGGLVSHALVEHVDIMATLIEAAGLPPVPVCPVAKPWKTALCTEGTSMMPLIKNPTRAWKNASYSQYPRKGSPPKIMGYSMRLVEVRFTAWVDFDGIRNETTWTMDQKDCGFELYNLTADPLENRNLAYHDGMQQKVKMHFEQLKAGWRATASALPSAATVEA